MPRMPRSRCSHQCRPAHAPLHDLELVSTTAAHAGISAPFAVAMTTAKMAKSEFDAPHLDLGLLPRLLLVSLSVKISILRLGRCQVAGTSGVGVYVFPFKSVLRWVVRCPWSAPTFGTDSARCS